MTLSETVGETAGETASPHDPSRPWQILTLALAALAGLCAASSWLLPEVDGSDLWWHMSAGRWVWTHGAVPLQDLFTHTEFGQDWADHEWLWGVGAWLAYEVDPDLVAWLNLMVAIAVFAMVGWRAFDLSKSWAAALLVTALAAAASHWYIDVRPHLFTLLFTALYLATFRFRFAPWLWPPVMLLWVNLHGGFIFGVGLVGLHALVRSVRARLSGEPIAWRDWLGVSLTVIAVGFNPWGFAMYLEPFEHLRHATPFSQLLEWVPLEWSVDPSTYAGRFSWLGALALLGFWRGRRDPTALLLVVLTAVMTTRARRFVPLFAVVAAPVAALGIAPLFEAIARSRRWPNWLPALTAASALGASLLLWQDVRFLPQPLARWTMLESSPTGAVRYLAALENPPTRLFNSYHWGGYISYFAPATLIFIDGRAATLYSDATVADYHTLNDAKPGWREVLQRHRIDAVLVERPSLLANALSREDPPWRRVDMDPRSLLMFPAPREDLVPIEELLGDSADLHLSRAFFHRVRRQLDAADAEVRETLLRDPLQLYAYAEGMMTSAYRKDVAGVQAWIDAALAIQPQRSDLIATFAERAWRVLGDTERSIAALESLELGGPFVTPIARENIRMLIEELKRRQASGEPAAEP